jgi:hypothetical protein
MERKSVRSLGKDLHDPRTMLPVTSVVIDWSSAVVKPKGRYPELAARLSTAPDSV